MARDILSYPPKKESSGDKIFEKGKVTIYTQKSVLDSMPDDDVLIDLAELFKIFGDSTRIRILYALLSRRMSVGELSDVLEMKQPAISHQLKILRQNMLVKCHREGKQIIYELADGHVTSIISQGVEHVTEPRQEVDNE